MNQNREFETRDNVLAMKQILLFKDNVPKEFGGSLLIGKRKGKRPLDTKKPIHLVLKASNSFQLLRMKRKVMSLISRFAAKFEIKIYSSGVHADHVHLEILISSRKNYNAWVRSVTGLMSRKIGGLKFKFRPYTRLLSWDREFKKVKKYISKNHKEGEFYLRAHSISEGFYFSIWKQLSGQILKM